MEKFIQSSVVEIGGVVTFLSMVLLLLYSYFKRLINEKSLFERLFENQNKTLADIIHQIQRIKEDLVEVKAMLRGSFRTRGNEDD